MSDQPSFFQRTMTRKAATILDGAVLVLGIGAGSATGASGQAGEVQALEADNAALAKQLASAEQAAESAVSDAREAGTAPVRVGDPGYGRHLDRDGDCVGRKNTLALVIMITSGATLVMGLLPTWQQVGLLAPIMLIGVAGFLLLTYPTLMLMGAGSFAAAVAMVFLGVFMAAYDGAMSAAMTELFPTNVRYGSMAIAYNVAVAIFGGITPWFSQSLIIWTGNQFAPAFYVMAAALVTGIVVLIARETAHEPLKEA